MGFQPSCHHGSECFGHFYGLGRHEHVSFLLVWWFILCLASCAMS